MKVIKIGKISKRKLAILFKKIFFMLEAGIGISKAINILYINSLKNKKEKLMNKILGDIDKNILAGQSFSSCLLKYKKYFSGFIISMIKAGESSGNLNQVIYKLANYYEREADLAENFSRVLIYPVIVCIMMLAVLIFALVFVIPSYSQMFGENDLPVMTKFVVGISNFVCNYYLFLIAILIIFFLALKIFFKSDRGKLFYGKFLFLSFIRKIYRPYLNFMFAQILNIMLSSGVNIVFAILNAKEVIDNKFLDNNFEVVIKKIKSGEKISQAIGETKIFDEILVEMINIGESSGNLSNVAAHCEKYFESEFMNNIRKLEKLIEPILTIAIGLILAIIMLAIMEPSFSMGDIL